MHISQKHIRDACRRLMNLAAASLLLNLAIAVVVVLWGLPWFGPLLVPAVMLSVVSVLVAKDARRVHQDAAPMEIVCDAEALRVGDARFEPTQVRLEYRPWTMLVWRRLPDHYTAMTWAEQKPYMKPLLSLNLPTTHIDQLIAMTEQATFSIHDRRKSLRWGILWLYGLVVVLVAAMLAWKLLLLGGLAAVFMGSDVVGETLGVHPAAVFFAFIGVGVIVWGVRWLRRR